MMHSPIAAETGRRPSPASQAAGVRLQRRCACGDKTAGGTCQPCLQARLRRGGLAAADVAPPIVEQVLAGSGRPLDAATRAAMGTRFGHDFSGVRVHTDARAAQSADAVDASAYTVGRDIVFAAGRYAPQTPAGERLLAHELSHVVQQSSLTRGGGPLPIADPAGADERAAQRAEQGAAPPGASAAGALTLGRTPTGETAPGAGAAARPPAREVIDILLGHREAGGLGRFDTLLYRDCGMKVQFRMNFNFTGAWPGEADKRSWQQRFITGVRSAWSDRFDLQAAGTCAAGCSRVRPFVEIYAPHNAPHVNVDVQYATSGITSRAGSGVAHLDSLDLTPVRKGDITAEQRRTEGVGEMTPAVHEFGHLVGRRDQYAGPSSCATGYPMAGIMCFGNRVTEADYLPFANAAREMTGCSYTVAARSGAAPASASGG